MLKPITLLSAKKGIFCAIVFAHMPIIRDIIYGAASRGASVVELCAELKIPVDHLNDSGKSVDFKTAYRVWELAVKQTRNPILGLHLGETASPSILGLIGHLMQSSPDLLTAYQQVCKHAPLTTDMFQYSLETGREHTTLMYTPAPVWRKVSEDSARQATDQAMAGTLNVFYLLSGKKIRPVKAEVSFPKRKVNEYERVFGTVTFGTKRNALTFKTIDLQTAVTSYDQSLFALFDTLVREKLSALKHKTSLTDIVRKILTEDFKGQIVPAEVVASKIAMSVRTFQRKLNEEGSSYREVSTELRKSMARKLLKQRDASVTEVAKMLGYSEASALRKAMKG